MPDVAFELVRDPRGSQIHVRDRRTGECLGCIEVGLYEIVRSLVLQERDERGHVSDRVEGLRC
jgi:hypothetical protein